MMRVTFFLIINLCLYLQTGFAQKEKTDANIFGHVICQNCDEHITFATISVKGTTIGTTTDETGHFQLINLPEGTHTIRAEYLGYKPKEIDINVNNGETKELNFALERDILGLEEVVITGDRNEINRRGSSTIVNTITPKLFTSSQSLTLSEGLNFCPGLRMENDCQNCGFSQVRINGMDGPYSQILINSRPVFSGLAGVYGLDLIPAAMIERIEVMRGGGSVLYGSNAIAGTINVILKDPINNSYEFGMNAGVVGMGTGHSAEPAQDYSLHFNTSLVSADNKTGMALYGFYRDREPFFANNDVFSEIPSLLNTTMGTRVFHRFSVRSKLITDFFHIREDRRGGDRFEYPVHEANIAEALKHNLTTGALTFEQYFRENDLFSAYISGQRIHRDSYYGAEMSLGDYGKTKDFSYTMGAQYNGKLGRSNVVAGIEGVGSSLNDQKLGFPDMDQALIITDTIRSIPHVDNVTVADQAMNTLGLFAQYEINLNKLKMSAGVRFDNYKIVDNEQDDSDNDGCILIPRISVKYDFADCLQARMSYSQGYRAPQIYDEDLHIETSGLRKVIHKNSPDLKQETSHSFMASLDFNKKVGKMFLGLLAESFFTHLNDPFANEFSYPDESGTVIYTRINAEKGAQVMGVNIEMNFTPFEKISFKSGFTVQRSEYKEALEFNEPMFFRTPQEYGYIVIDWHPLRQLDISSTGNYTGKMLVPYFGLQIPDPQEGELRETPRFFDFGLKVLYKIKLNGATLQLFAGVKNLFNSYQDDFDSGMDRDPGYIYGPMNPRTVYTGLKIGNSFR
ncbi:MAG: TonB-dependent receptor [Bacteroidales bacterium]|nr:TonB-dependent receptor [Bacteroidales bacterium]